MSHGIVKEKYGSDYSGSGASDVDDSDDSEDTEEDSDGEELTPAVDAAILRTLALIRKRDPAIYEGGRQVFEGVFRFSRSCVFVTRYVRREPIEEHTRTQDKAPSTKSRIKEKVYAIHI